MSNTYRGLWHSLLLAGALVLPPAILHAQDTYPIRPIQLIVPVPPGGAADFIARAVGAKLADALGQSVVINNRGGAGGTIPSAGLATAHPGGDTLRSSAVSTPAD